MKICIKMVVLLTLLLVSFSSANGVKHWVFFKDKGISSEEEFVKARNRFIDSMSDHALQRRLKTRTQENLVDMRDLPLADNYIQAISEIGAVIHNRSRWFNGVSITADESVLKQIESLDFVREVTPVVRYRIKKSPETEGIEFTLPSTEYSLSYGFSFAQLDQLNIPIVHELGVTGESVIVCITDTGFRTSHAAFAGLDLLDQYDFVMDDGIVSEEPGDWGGQMNHGTSVWSALAAAVPDQLYGPAYGASFLLAKTEDLSQEMPVEEDNWIAAMEWADSLGADLISCSLGYIDWDDATRYMPEDLDGNTARITVAADIAASRGILVCTAAGNSGPGRSTLVTPADADSVISCGAVGINDSLVAFSSQGPTADGRIKPTLMALGAGTQCASAYSDESYGSSSGTSLSTPLLAGGCALLLQVHPTWGPMQVIEALTNTASRSTSPSNQYGWGIPDFFAAISYPIDGEVIIPILEGWNMISVPLNENITSIDAYFPEAIGGFYSYDPEVHTYQEVDTLEPGRSYFLLYPHDTLVSIPGTAADSIVVHLKEGWNMIGGNKFRTPWSSFVTDPEAALLGGSLFNYDPLSKTYNMKWETLPGAGFWVFAVTECDLILFID